MLNVNQTSALGPPYGTCTVAQDRSLEYFTDQPYTESKCRLEMLTTYAEKQCGCRDSYMPGLLSFIS